MANEQRPSDADLDELSAKLNDGLKTCRSMVENYRAMLRGEQSPAANDPDPVWTGEVPPTASAE